MFLHAYLETYVEEATSQLNTVDFDKLKASLVNLRKQNLKLTVSSLVLSVCTLLKLGDS